MTHDEHVREVYAYFGLAVYYAQVLEHGIVNAMVLLRLPTPSRFTKGDIDAFMDQQFENTLGKLIMNLRADVGLPPDLENLLTRALKTRNWLCHEYFRERVMESMTAQGRDGMIAELADAKELLIRADKRLGAVVQPLADRLGVTEAALKAEFQALCKEHGVEA